jgi:hypothetical protein
VNQLVPFRSAAASPALVAAAGERARDKSLEATVFCRADKVPRLQLTSDYDVQDMRDAIPDLHFSIFETEIDDNFVSVKSINNRAIIEIDWRSVNIRAVKAGTKFCQWDTVHSHQGYVRDYDLSDDGHLASASSESAILL